jgi:hypothetical protein
MGCILAAVVREGIENKLNIPDRYELLSVITLAKP